jgi:cell division protein FtsN
MPRNDEGEFEMVLGNRQLLSIFFIVVILLAVFFSMGYLMGRGSGSGSGPTLAKTAPAEPPMAPKPEATPPGSEVAADPLGAAQGEQHPPDLAPGQAVVSTTPVAPSETQPVQAAPQEAAARPPEAKPAEPVAAASGPLPGQIYLQVAATSRPEAELEVGVLKKRGFPALTAPVPNGSAFRVLVGPMKDSADIAKTKLDLDALGFKTILIRKY